jgi:hypothetical protein
VNSQTDLTAAEIADLFEAGRRTCDKIVEQLGPGWDSPDKDAMVARAVSNLMGDMGDDIFKDADESLVELLAVTGNDLASHYLARKRQRHVEEALGDD